MEDAAVRVFLEILRSGTAAEFLRRMGFVVGPDLGQIVSRDPTNP
jgi:hypothetical protein